MSFKKDEELGGISFYNDKTTVIQEARVFNESPISPRKCRALLTRIVYLLYAGETFSTQEATTLFFGVTKLFQHKDAALRQMVYLVVKELSTIAEDVIMVTSSIMKDMQPNLEVIYRPNAIRALARIIDAQSVQSVERFFKSALVDKSSSISSASLVSSYHLFNISPAIIKRWANEAQEAVNAKAVSSGGGYANAGGYLGGGSSAGFQAVASSSYIMQYHALGLLYLMREKDRMAITKMVQQLGAGGKGSSVVRNPMAVCMLIRFARKVMDEDPNVQKQMHEYLEGLLRHKSDMVNIEAARAICEMRNVTVTELFRPVSVLQLFLASPKPVLKFAAIKTLNKLAMTQPAAVTTCNLDMENLITDSNRSIATYAITTLLKTGNEASVDRLMKQISSFMSDITDEFKIIVVDAIRSLCLKFPAKQAVMLTFLSGVLRDEGGYEFKQSVVEAIFDMIKYIKDCRETALAHLCEFIEDCEFTKLSVRILHLLGLEGPKTSHPTKYIRYIYNRVVLENAVVRAAAVSSLAKFGVCVNDSKVMKSVHVLLRRCLEDVDDEVRDRAAMYLKVLDEQSLADAFVREEATFSLATLESELESYVKDNGRHSTAFEISSIPKISREQASAEAASSRPSALESIASSSKTAEPSPAPVSAAETQSSYSAQIAAVPELSSYGPILKSSPRPIQLTESETEYVVSLVKHVFKEHVVFQFNVSNTIPDTVLDEVTVLMVPGPETGLTEDFIIPIDSLNSARGSGQVYVSFTRDDPAAYAGGSFGCTLRFVSKEVDPTSGEPEEEGYQDEYQVEDCDLGAADYIIPTYVTFANEWDKLASASSVTETFALSSSESLKDACKSLIEVLGMEPLGGTESPTSNSVHTLNMSGMLSGGGGKVLARCRMTFAPGSGVTLELAVRAEKEEAAKLVMAAI
ncbi:adaptin N terminal region-domain-containing protein [Kockovaella imperatae]|uniref:Coatomer subunit gamma n=1 Tax=Kockovaella imperatae TaxID=4999 RepID=A0A1Y1UGY0_9TREE|nr:adaptin N terminal region-domain-containing protein [Kockovaella imperatae]ORX37310.1 adaptin N terminal region-domain-containing protein [Kockovaella imperatae]